MANDNPGTGQSRQMTIQALGNPGTKGKASEFGRETGSPDLPNRQLLQRSGGGWVARDREKAFQALRKP